MPVEKKTLGELLIFMTTGSRGWATYYQETGDLFLRIQNVGRNELLLNDVAYVCAPDSVEARRTKVEPNDVLLSVTADLGRTAVVPEGLGTAYINQHLALLRVRDVDPRYLSAFIASPDGRRQIDRRNRHGVKAGLNFEDVRSLEIPLPPLSEQKRIAEILDRAEALRAKRRAALALLDELTQSIFLDMFGDPVSNPKGWETTSIGKHATKIGSGATPRGGDESYKSVGISLIRSLNVRDGELTLRDLAFIDDEQARKLDNVIVERDDVLLNITGASVARVCRVPQHILPARVNQHVCIIRTSSTLNSRFLEAQLLTPQMKRKLLGIAEAGATRQAITKSQVEGFQIIMPPRKLQDEFDNRMTKLSEVREFFLKTSSSFDHLFTSLQHRAFRGEL